MDRIDFDAKVDSEGLIRVPREYVNGLAKDENIHVTLSSEIKRERKSLKLMREHPLNAPGAKPLSREEIYDRSK